MNKYDSLKFLKETGEIYYPESIGKVNAPGIKLKKFCKNCYQKYGDKLFGIEIDKRYFDIAKKRINSS